MAAGAALLTCRAGGEPVALPAAAVAAVVRVPDCTRVPNGPASLVGLANLRGTVLPVVSLAKLLGHEVKPEGGGAGARVVVLAGDAPAGLLVEAVGSLSEPGGERVLDPHELLARAFGAVRRRAGLPGLATEVAAPATPRNELSVIVLSLAGQDYALRLDEADAVMRVPSALAAIPRTDGAMLGAVAFRDGVLPVVSLRVLLGLPAAAPGPAARILVVHGTGLLVDSIGGVLAVPADAVDPVPPVLLRRAGEAVVVAICRLDGGRRLVCLLSADRLFDGATAARIRREGRAPSTSGAAGPAAAFVVFRLGGEQYGLPAGAVESVVRRPVLTPMPHGPDFIAGIMNLRGRAVPVIDASQRFGAPAGPERGRRVIVLAADGVQAGFAVDAVSEVARVPLAELHAAPGLAGAAAPVFDRVHVRSGGRMILLVSPEELLRQAGQDILATIRGAAA